MHTDAEEVFANAPAFWNAADRCRFFTVWLAM
jgi:hypothetical protein